MPNEPLGISGAEPPLMSKPVKITQSEKLHLFISYDLCDFTKFKGEYNDKWPSVVQHMWTALTDKSNLLSKMDLWKFKGDEFIFHQKVNTLTSMADCIKTAYDCMRGLESWLRVFIEDNLVKKSLDKKPVRVKAGAWLVNTCPISWEKSFSTDYKNYKPLKSNYRIKSATNAVIDGDFIGINMDEGFRMCGCADKGRFLVDPKIAFMFHLLHEALINPDFQIPKKLSEEYIEAGYSAAFLADFLSECKASNNNLTKTERGDVIKFAENLAFVGLKHCKGVWGDRHYPIIWYASKWKDLQEIPRKNDSFVVKILNRGTPEANLDKLGSLFNRACAIDNLSKIMSLVKIAPTKVLVDYE